VNYILQQFALFRNGGRRSADPRKGNVNEMIQVARFVIENETKSAAAYFAAQKWRQGWTRAIESATARKTRQYPAGLFLPLDGSH